MLHDIILFCTGIIVGVMNAIAGGGMLLGFPVLLATGVPAIVANATGGIIILPGQISSAFGYREYLKRIPRAYLLLAIPCFTGAAIGAHILRHTSSQHFAKIVPLLLLFALGLFIFQPFLYKHLHHHMHGPAKHRQRIKPLFIVGLAMFPVSIYGGYFGAGFGFIMLAFLGFTKLHEVHQMNALKNVMAVCIASASILTLSNSGLIDWRHGLVMASGNFIGGYSGARLAQKVSSHAIRVVVIAIGLTTASYLFFRSY